jgi:hypothetical protein
MNEMLLMEPKSVWRRSWMSVIGADRQRRGSNLVAVKENYGLGRRCLAAVLGVELPDKPLVRRSLAPVVPLRRRALLPIAAAFAALLGFALVVPQLDEPSGSVGAIPSVEPTPWTTRTGLPAQTTPWPAMPGSSDAPRPNRNVTLNGTVYPQSLALPVPPDCVGSISYPVPPGFSRFQVVIGIDDRSSDLTSQVEAQFLVDGIVRASERTDNPNPVQVDLDVALAKVLTIWWAQVDGPPCAGSTYFVLGTPRFL